MIDRIFSAQFMRFILAGGSSAAVTLISRWVLSHYVLFEIAVIVSYLIGMTIAFLLMRAFVFNFSPEAIATSYFRFAVVNFFAALIVFSVSVSLARVVFPRIGFMWHAEDVAHLIGVCSPVLFSFYGHMKYSFQESDS